jgi:hypothetical protein
MLRRGAAKVLSLSGQRPREPNKQRASSEQDQKIGNTAFSTNRPAIVRTSAARSHSGIHQASYLMVISCHRIDPVKAKHLFALIPLWMANASAQQNSQPTSVETIVFVGTPEPVTLGKRRPRSLRRKRCPRCVHRSRSQQVLRATQAGARPGRTHSKDEKFTNW